MPRVVKTSGVNLSGEVFKIRDAAPVRPKPAPKPRPMEGEEGAEGFEPEALDGAQQAEASEDGYESADSGESYETGGAVKSEIIQGAMAEAGRILEDAVKQAESARNEMMAKIQYDADRMKAEATEQGRREGFASVIGEVRDAANALENTVAAMEGERAGFEAEYEDQMKWMAIEIASKVLAKKVSDDDAEMTEMVLKAVQSVRNEPWIRVEVAQEMVRLIDQLGTAFEGQDNIEVSPIPASPGTVQIETPSGVVDASLQTQLANLRDYFATAAN